MTPLLPLRPLAPGDRPALAALLDAAERADGHEALGDGPRRELDDGRGFSGTVAPDGDGEIRGYAHVSHQPSGAWGVELVLHPAHRSPELADRLGRAAIAQVRRAGGGTVHLWSFGVTPADDALAGRLGLRPDRELHRLTVPLPRPETPRWPPGFRVRTFEVGRDEEAWLRVNNRAFEGHPEQSGWDLTTLRRREREPWFDPAGLLLVEDDDGLAGSCWTKLHPPGDVGEIYVIAVDPDRQGLGLGRALTLSGLASLAERGATTGMLFVDGANTAALRLYDSLGFALARLDRAYVGEVRP